MCLNNTLLSCLCVIYLHLLFRKYSNTSATTLLHCGIYLFFNSQSDTRSLDNSPLVIRLTTSTVAGCTFEKIFFLQHCARDSPPVHPTLCTYPENKSGTSINLDSRKNWFNFGGLDQGHSDLMSVQFVDVISQGYFDNISPHLAQMSAWSRKRAKKNLVF